jgi:predicted dehydrogenase
MSGRGAIIGIGLIGSGFIGKAHALAYRSAPAVFPDAGAPGLRILADVDPATAAHAADAFGFESSTGDWRELLTDPAVDVIDITTPNHLHEEMALAAIRAGKHVYCEKPLAPTGVGARRMFEAARAAEVQTMVGFNYLKNPMAALARQIIESGEIGEVFAFRGTHFEDYMHDPGTLVNPWRLDPAAGDGVASDLGSHAVAMARFLVGDITSVSGRRITVLPERSVAAGTMRVSVPDTVHAHLTFATGATGTIEVSWMAPGHKHTITAEVWATKGTLSFDFERLNELRLYEPGQAPGRAGFKTILAGPEHPGYGAFIPAPGHQLSFIDLKTIEVADLLRGLNSGAPLWPDFGEGLAVQLVLDAIEASDRSGRAVDVPTI